MATLGIRTELFEQGLYPHHQGKLTTAVLVTLFTNLNLLSSIDYKIKLSQWVDQSVKYVQGLTEQDAKVYFLTYRALLEDIENVMPNKEAPLSDYQVDVRCFALFIAIQMYSAQSKYATESRSNLAKDSWGIKENHAGSSSQGASPRSKYTKINYTQSEYQIISHFIKSNLKLLLRLISTDIHTPEVSLSASEFNTLRILFKIQQPSGLKAPVGASMQLSQLTPFFQSGGHQVKVHMNVIIDWLNQIISQHEPEGEVQYLNNLNKCVTIKESTVQNKDVRIQGCEDSYIYIDTNVQFMQISNCINCTIMVGAVNKTCSIEKCENVTVCVASNFLRIGNCVDCTLHTFTQIAPPVIYGDTRNLIMAPHNASYFELLSHLRAADIMFIPPGQQVPQSKSGPASHFLENIHNFAKPIMQTDTSTSIFTLMQPVDFIKMSLPKKFSDQQLFLCPQEYIDVLMIRAEHFKEIQQKIKGAQLSPDQEKMLHVAIQGYFREWFVQSSQYKPITELVRMIDQEFL